MTMPMLDLDAAKREARYPDGLPVVLGGQTFMLPAELPAEVLDPLLSDRIDLAGIIAEFLGGKTDDQSFGDALVDLLSNRPDLPSDLIGAVKDVFAVAFGADQYAAFVGKSPSLQDYGRILKYALPLYGNTLGEAFASAASSESDGQTPKPTSDSSAASTPATAGDPSQTPAS